jgi:hydrogenase 3 maturation protease
MSRPPEIRLPMPKLAYRHGPDCLPRVAVLGIGHELRGDDAIGIAIARALQALVSFSERLLVIDVGPAPENFTGMLRRFKPDLVLMVDAAHLDEAPGAVRWVPWRDTAGFSASTHALPLRILGDFLASELECEVVLLGIQPANTAIGAPLSPVAQKTVKTVVRVLHESFHPYRDAEHMH